MAVAAEVLGEPELVEIPDRVGDEPAQQEQPGSLVGEHPAPGPGGTRFPGGVGGRGFFDQAELVRAEEAVFPGLAVEQEPRDEPDQSGRTGDHECHAPSGAVAEQRGDERKFLRPGKGRQRDDQIGCQGGSDGRAHGVEADRQRPLPRREPFRDRFGGGRPDSGLAEAEGEAAERHRPDALGTGGDHVGKRPPGDEHGHAGTRAQAVRDPPRDQVGDGVGDQENVHHVRIVPVIHPEVRLDRGGQGRERLAVHVVQDRRREDQGDDPPAQAGNEPLLGSAGIGIRGDRWLS